MPSSVLKVDDLCPDRVRVVVMWDKMLIGSSVFVPCIDTQAAKNQATEITKRKGWEIDCQTRIEGKKLGVRIWRRV